MKSFTQSLTTVTVLFFISTISPAQHRNRGNEINRSPQNQTRHHSTQNYALAYNPPPQHHPCHPIHANYYITNNLLHLKKTTRTSIRQSAYIIKKALTYFNYGGNYSLWLTKAVRHQQYAKKLYVLGNYTAAMYHTERAGFLAWQILNDVHYSDIYSFTYPDTYEPLDYSRHRTRFNENSKKQDLSLKEISDKSSMVQNYENKEELDDSQLKDFESTIKLQENSDDEMLPNNQLNDTEILKLNEKDLDVD